MCQKTSKRGLRAPLSSCMMKFAVVLAIFLSAECAAGACLSYGHACWGAHGKRSGDQGALSRLDNEAQSNRDEAKADWFLSKMISPLDLRYYPANELDAPKNQPEIDDLFTDVEGENSRSANDWDKIREMLKTSNRFAPAENARNVEGFLKSPKFLDKRSAKEQ